jgi:hypothetical protein
MSVFLDWLNKLPDMDEVLKSGIAHLWLVTIPPFDDGNGRIGRAIADMLLARSEKSPQRFYKCPCQSPISGKRPGNLIEQPPDPHPEPVTRRLRREIDNFQVCKTRKVFAGYGAA